MGIDYGAKRIGVAFTDEAETMAFPHSVVENNVDVFYALKKLAEEKQAKKIVVGLPLALDGEPTDATAGAREFAKRLGRETGLALDFADERFTSAQARRAGNPDMAVDASSAALILEQYISRDDFMKRKMG